MDLALLRRAVERDQQTDVLVAVPNKHRPERVWDAARAAIEKATGA